jgi:hypothetical protein
MREGNKVCHVWDVFICHASEDKDFAKPLAETLRKEGVRVWFDEFEIKLGESIVSRIEHGLVSSKAGIIVLSPHALEKGWTTYESNAFK